MEDIKVGDYVRTEWGDIEKIIKIDKENIIVNIEEDEEGRTYCKMCYKNEIKKSSPNIIDLIEIGDFVEIIADGQPLRCEVDEFDYKNKLKDIGEEIIVKSIVTKEQFNSIKYKLEE